MTTNKQTLRHKARLASADEWVKESGDGWEAICSSDDQANAGFVIAHFEGPDAKSNREFVQAANPATVLALLDELEAAEQRNAELMEKQRLIDICQGQGLEHRIAAEKRAEAAEKKLAKLIDILDWHTIELGWGEKPITLAELIVSREGADSLSTFLAAATDKGE